MALGAAGHNLVLDPAAVAAGAQTDLDKQGIAKNARQEKLQARAASKSDEGNGKDAAHHEKMAQLYRQHVLKEEAAPLVQIQGLGKKGDQKEPVGA